MSRVLLPCLFLVAALPALVLPAAADHHKGGDHGDGNNGDGDFVTMWDGKSLDGWKLADENQDAFSIDEEKGAIKASGQRCHLFYVANDKPFRNFEFRAKVMTEPNSNGGIYFHTRYQDTGWPAGGFEAQVNNSYKKDPKLTGSLYAVTNVMEAPAADNEWFDYMIRVEGDHVRIEIDGKPVVDYYEPAGAKAGKGFDRVLGAGTFAIQAHDPGSTAYFKEIRVKRLD